MPRHSVAHVRARGGHAAEMVTQALMGMPLKVVGDGDAQWVNVELPDGYRGYIRSNALTLMSDDDMARWRKMTRYVVVGIDEQKVYADTVSRRVLTDVVDCDILVADGVASRNWARVKLPDGRTGWIASSLIMPIEQWASQKFDGNDIAAFAERHLGTPYTWGGNSSKGMDCSGLVKMCLLHYGVILQRDACQQALWGESVEPFDLRCGDLVFYGNKSTGHVDHVAIYVGNDTVIESAGMVRYGRPACGERFMLARRVIGVAPSQGIMGASSHRWYF